MKPIEHFKSYCTFWKPSLARRITLYFLAFGLIIFLITSGLHMVGAKKQFMHSTGKIIRNQFFRLSGAEQPDFLWNGIGQRQPSLYRLIDLLRQMTSNFYSVNDISIYSRRKQGTDWYRLFLKENGVLQAEAIRDGATRKLERGMQKRFGHSRMNFYESDTALSGW